MTDAVFTQDVELAKAERIGANGLSASAMADAVMAVRPALARLREDDKAGRLALLAMPATQADLPEINAAAARLKAGATDLVILGTGGSSLGAQALAMIADHAVPGLGRLAPGLRLHFMDNLDPATYGALLLRLPLPTTRFVAISKSGGTGETLMQAMAVIAALEASGLGARVGDLVMGLSEPQAEGAKRNALRNLLEPNGVSFLPHHTGIGGRYSVLTNVGLLPTAAIGLDIAKVRAGAALPLADLRNGGDVEAVPAALGAALNVAAAKAGKNIHVMMAYADRFALLMKWWVQLWAESVGKDGEGTQPVAALGPVDQHSQMQLYLGGPKDKLFTVVTTDVAGRGPTIRPDLAQAGNEPDFAGRTIGDLVAAQGRATADTLARNGCATRRLHVPRIDETSMGAVMMHLMLETILAGYALGIDPFDQPAVEEGKILAKQYLAQSKA
jgi:glucose-6-phosphate isomerase